MTAQPSFRQRMEFALAVVFSGAWVAAILVMLRVLPLAGTLDIDLYSLFSAASALGWVAGNVYLSRARRAESGRRRRFLILYLFGPTSFLYLARALAARDVQAAAPLVPILSFLVFAIFFAVPITFSGGRK